VALLIFEADLRCDSPRKRRKEHSFGIVENECRRLRRKEHSVQYGLTVNPLAGTLLCSTPRVRIPLFLLPPLFIRPGSAREQHCLLACLSYDLEGFLPKLLFGPLLKKQSQL
jgi:hypothetical protein